MADGKGSDMGTAEGALPGRSGRGGDVLDVPEMEGLTLYEKKALLVNRELDGHGMGEDKCMLSVPRRTQCLVGRMALNQGRLVHRWGLSHNLRLVLVRCADSASF